LVRLNSQSMRGLLEDLDQIEAGMVRLERDRSLRVLAPVNMAAA
jgi:hypothetical protein